MLIKAEWPTLGIGAQRRNLLINGNMDIWQRGLTFSATGALGFAADRWRVYASGVATPVQRNTADARSEFCLGFTGATGNTECAMLQRIENINSRQLNLQDISVSGAFFSQAVGTPVTCLLYKPVSVNDYTTKTLLWSKPMGTITQNSFTDLKVTFPASLFGGGDFTNGVEVVFSYGAVANTIIVAATRVQLEIGPASTPFEFRPIGEELELCHRYYEKIDYVNGGKLGVGQVYTASTGSGVIYVGRKRSGAAVPTLSSGLIVLNAAGENAGGSITAIMSSDSNVIWSVSGAAGLVAGNCTTLFANSPTCFLSVSAEI